jgi:hypothetical protein
MELSMTFKIGDKVRIVKVGGDVNHELAGKETTIVEIRPKDTWPYELEIGGVFFGSEIESVAPEVDLINHPPHYTGYEGFEVIQITEQLPFLEGNVVKYVLRAGRKDDALADLEKAEFYLKRLIQNTKEKA